MNSFAFAVIVAFVVIALFATRRKSRGGGSGRGGNGANGKYRGPRHGAFKDYVREKEKNRREQFGGNQNGDRGGQFGDFGDVKYREESVPFNAAGGAQFKIALGAQSKNSVGAQPLLQTLDAKLSDDAHGVFGEAATSAIVARVAHDSGGRHYLLQNVYIPTHTGYTEIDTVLLHESGIYVFETKNVSGEVSGDLKQERWNLYLNERTQHTLYNPLKQNQGHIGALLCQLRTSYSRARVYSFVVFSDRCVLKRVPASGNRFQVIHFGELQAALANVLKHSTNVHNKKQLDEWKAALQSCVNVSESVKQAHRASVQKMHDKRS